MNRALRAQLNTLRHAPGLKPRSAWVDATRASLVRTIETAPRAVEEQVALTWLEKATGMARLFVPPQVMVIARSAAILFLAGSVAVGGWIVGASASQDSLPGETLYGVKLAIEKTEVAVAGVVASPQVAAAKELEFAARRVTEVKNSPHTEQKVVALQSLQQSMDSANKRLEKAVLDSPDQALAVAQVVNEKTEQILDTLHATTVVAATTLTSSTTLPTDSIVTAEVQETEKRLEQTGVQAVQVLITNGNTDSVKESVEKKLEKVTTDLTTATTAASTTLSTAIVSSNLSTSTASTATGTTIGLVTSPGIGTTSTLSTGTSTVQLTSTKQVQEKIGAAKDFLQDNNLQGALEKVKELYDIKNEAKNVVIQADMTKNLTGTTVLETPKNTGTSTLMTATSTIPLLLLPAGATPSTATTTGRGATTTVPTLATTPIVPPPTQSVGIGKAP